MGVRLEREAKYRGRILSLGDRNTESEKDGNLWALAERYPAGQLAYRHEVRSHTTDCLSPALDWNIMSAAAYA